MIAHKGTVTIKTGRLLLRKIVESDAEDMFVWMGDPEVCRYERWEPHPNAAYTRGFIKHVHQYDSDRRYQWGIELTNRLIGYVVAVNVDDYDQKAAVGYCLSREFWSQGYTTEAVRAVVHFIFTEVGLNRLEASHSVNNPASGRVLEKSGFMLEGIAKEYYNCNAGLQDSKLYGITKSMYFK